jgi:DNA-binding transcriptional regulator GbsR (MarR family)
VVERRKREIDPTLSMLRDALMESPSSAEDLHAQERMKEMHEFMERMTDWLDEVQKMDSAMLASLMKMGAKVQKLVEMKDRVKQVFTSASAARKAALNPATLDQTSLPNDEVEHGHL